MTSPAKLFQLMNFWTLHIVAFVARLFFICVGIYQDQTLAVKYTDIDYDVFTDASCFVTQGKSPYNRSTYRYTPLLAWLLSPNIYLTPHFGKLLFVCCDISSGVLLYKILSLRGVSSYTACCFCALWLLNPLSIGVTTRGNGDTLLSFLVLYTLNCLKQNRLIAAAFFYGLSIHMKIYTVIYALPIALFITSKDHCKCILRRCQRLFNRDLFKFVAVAGAVFFGLSLIFYFMYGWDFLYETYFYHLTRRDVRHNFSPYFYMFYLNMESEKTWVLGVAAFLPQVILLVFSSLAFHADLPLCCFLNTAIFVSFNKVCTSQYFLWYLCLLPLVLPYLGISVNQGVGLLLLWFTGQGVWLAPAYYLEFEGCNSFVFIWCAGLLFLVINSVVIIQVIKAFIPERVQQIKKGK